MKMFQQQCNHVGCMELTQNDTGCCDAHEVEYLKRQEERKLRSDKRYDENRLSPSLRGYDSDWIRVRRAQLQCEPLCHDCIERGRIIQASEVHHIVAIRKDKSKRLDQNNLRSLCSSCHAKYTARGE